MKRSGRRLFAGAADVWTSTVLIYAAFLIASAHMAHAGINVWAGNGPYGGLRVPALAIDPATPSTLYAGTDGGGVFQSTNSGGSWSPVNNGLSNLYVYALAIDPSTPSTLYAGTRGGGVFQSTNTGGSWSPVSAGLSDLIVGALAIDPATPSTLYAGTCGGVFSIQQVSVCVGDCNDDAAVSVDEILTLVNIALGTAQPAACSGGGLPIGGEVDIAVIPQAVNNALNGCQD